MGDDRAVRQELLQPRIGWSVELGGSIAAVVATSAKSSPSNASSAGTWEPPAESPAWLADESRPIVLVTASTSYQADERLIAVSATDLRTGARANDQCVGLDLVDRPANVGDLERCPLSIELEHPPLRFHLRARLPVVQLDRLDARVDGRRAKPEAAEKLHVRFRSAQMHLMATAVELEQHPGRR